MIKGKKIDINTKRKVLTQLVTGEHTHKKIAELNNICLPTLYKIREQNIELYQRIIEQKKEHIGARAVWTAEKCLKRIKKDKIENSSALQLSQTASNLIDISKDKVNQITININNLPQSREEIINQILDIEPIKQDSIDISSDIAINESATNDSNQ